MNKFEVRNYFDYLYTKKLDLRTDIIMQSCRMMDDYLNEHFYDAPKSYVDASAPFSTKVYSTYNIFLYPLPGLYELFQEIKISYREFSENKAPAYVRGWLNVFNKGEMLDWHTHFNPQDQAWHGYYCVNVEPDSMTQYKIPLTEQVVEIDSYNNLLVMGKSDRDMHKTSDWDNPDVPRVTIAFDILPLATVPAFNEINHWIPL